jgi:hypothetical protein
MKRSPTIAWRLTVPIGISVLVLGVLLRCGGIACACNVPVFRYALERWQPDPYRVTLFHRGALTESQRTLLRPLEEASSGTHSANVVLRLVDVDAIKDDADRAMFEAQSPTVLPWLVAQYPKGLRIEEPVWAKPLTDDTVAKSLVDSPLRKELIRRLADGQTAVWLMLECGQTEKDEAVAAMLTDQLKELAQGLQLPELTSAPEDAILSTTPLQVSFSLLRVPRGVAAEKPLVDMLLGSEPDLVEFDEPMVFPVFGRGRALLPLIGAGITPDNIHESAAFLVGACSCEVKDLNPGFDLLLTANWDVLLFQEGPPPEVLAARTTVATGEPQLVDIPAGSAPAESVLNESASSHDSWFASNYLVIITLGSVLLAVFVTIASNRFGRRQA